MRNDPAIIEVAINGETSRSRNPHVPRDPQEIAQTSLACIEAGASIIHSHIESIRTAGTAAGERYFAGWAPVLKERPDAILYPTVVMHDDIKERYGHLEFLVNRGAASMGAFDPGSTSFGLGEKDGLPEKNFDYINSYSDIRYAFERMSALGIGPSLAFYDPSYARAVIAWHRAGKLPQGTFTKFYFGGDYDFLSGKRGFPSFGLFPTAKGLDAYLEMTESLNLPWGVAVLGGDVVACGLARLALERGGHIRLGLEDYGGEDTPTNLELVRSAAELCRQIGRPIATPAQARAILKLPAKR